VSAVRIRTARPADAVGIARVHVDSWRATYPGQLPDRYLSNLREGNRAVARMHLLAHPRGAGATFVAEEAGAAADGIVGFADCGPSRGGVPGYPGEFYAIYLVPEAQNRGIGRALMGMMSRHLLDHRCPAGIVWALESNQAARWFYERLGGRRIGARRSPFAGTTVEEVAYGWDDLVPLARAVAT